MSEKRYTAAEARRIDLERGGEGHVLCSDGNIKYRFDEHTLRWERCFPGGWTKHPNIYNLMFEEIAFTPATPAPIDDELEEAKKKYEGKLLYTQKYGSYRMCDEVFRQIRESRLCFKDETREGFEYLDNYTLASFQPPVWKCCHTEPPVLDEDTKKDVIIKLDGWMRNMISTAKKGAWAIFGVDNNFCRILTDAELRVDYPNAKWCELPRGEI